MSHFSQELIILFRLAGAKKKKKTYLKGQDLTEKLNSVNEVALEGLCAVR